MKNREYPLQEQPAIKNKHTSRIRIVVLLVVLLGGYLLFRGSSNIVTKKVPVTEQGTFWTKIDESGITFVKDHPYITCVGVFVAFLLGCRLLTYTGYESLIEKLAQWRLVPHEF